MSSSTCLLILNPRFLPECLLSLDQIRQPKVWVKNYTERELETVIPFIINDLPQFEYFVAVSDDCIVSENALEEVSRHLHDGLPVVTGYCNLDPITEWCSITKTPPAQPYATEATYDWASLGEVYASPDELIRTYHPSYALTGMSRDMWTKFPWRCFGTSGNAGWAADLDLSIRLVTANVPIYAPKRAFIYHTKPDWKIVDANIYERRALRVGKDSAEVIYDL